jgi:transcriptional regulator with XRE-family HTH domain
MTDSKATIIQGVNRASTSTGARASVRLVHLMEERHRLEIAARITTLRERSRWTQPEIADRLGLTLRGYQKIEEKGTTKYDRVEAIAKIHSVDPDWLWEGRERGPAPDPFASESTAAVDELRKELQALRHELLAEIGKVRKAQEAQRRQQAPAERKPARRRK